MNCNCFQVILRPRGTKFTTICKSNCLNPSFNETFDFPLTEQDKTQADTTLVSLIELLTEWKDRGLIWIFKSSKAKVDSTIS